MQQNTPLLPGISHRLSGRQRRSQLDQLRAQSDQWRASTWSRLCEIFGPWLPATLLAPTAKGVNSRQRTYPLPLTFWAFLSQVLSPGSSCREVVGKVQAWYAPPAKPPDSGTSAYCQARRRLPLAALSGLHQTSAAKLSVRVTTPELWLGRNVKENFKLVDTRAVLDKSAALPLSEWNYKQDTATRHVGPMAQDFYAAFGVGPGDKHIATVDADGVALATTRGLNEKVELGKLKSEARSRLLEERLQQKETEIAELKRRLKQLENSISKSTTSW